MYKVMKSFICRGCVNTVTGTGCTSVDIGGDAHLELVYKFCYLGDMLSVDGDADAAVETSIRIGWNKLKQLVALEGARPRGRPKKTWREIVEKDCMARGLNREDHSRWRKQIGMIDDHDECEWVNVFLVPAHPGCPGQNPKSRKTVVLCMCVLSVTV